MQACRVDHDVCPQLQWCIATHIDGYPCLCHPPPSYGCFQSKHATVILGIAEQCQHQFVAVDNAG